MADGEPRADDGAPPEAEQLPPPLPPPTIQTSRTIRSYLPSPPLPSPPQPSPPLPPRRRRPQRSRSPRDEAAAAAARFDKHFPQLDGPPEQFRSSFEVGSQVLRQQSGRSKRLVISTNRSRRRAAWKDKDRWWRAVTTLQGECEALKREYGISPGAAPSDRLPAHVLAKWTQYNCGTPQGSQGDGLQGQRVGDSDGRRRL